MFSTFDQSQEITTVCMGCEQVQCREMKFARLDQLEQVRKAPQKACTRDSPRCRSFGVMQCRDKILKHTGTSFGGIELPLIKFTDVGQKLGSNQSLLLT